MRRLLFVVARDQPNLWDHLRGDFANDEEVEVILDRRLEERRRRVQTLEQERRRTDRRQPHIENDLRYRSFVIVHEQQGALRDSVRGISGSGGGGA